MQVVLDKYLDYKRVSKMNTVMKKAGELLNELLLQDSGDKDDVYIHLYGNSEGDAYLVIPPQGPARLKVQAKDSPGDWLLMNYEEVFNALESLLTELDWLLTEGSKRLVKIYKGLSSMKALKKNI